MGDSTGTFDMEMCSGRDGLESLHGEWDDLHRRSCNPAFYTDWRWHRALAGHLLAEPVHYLCARRDGRLTAILPLQVRDLERGPISVPTLSFPLHDHIQLSDIVVEREGEGGTAFAAMMAFLEEHAGISWQCLHLKGVVDGAGLLSEIHGSGAEVVRKGASAYFDTSGSDAALVPQKLLHNIDRLRRKADREHGTVEVRAVVEGEGLRRAFEAFLEVEASGWKGEGGTATAIQRDPALVGFYQELLERFSADGSARINLLSFGDEVAAAEFCLRAGGTWSILKIGYRDSVKAFGPGNILLAAFLEEARADEAVAEVNLVTASGWSERWHPRLRDVSLVTGFRNSLQGRALKVIHHCRMAMAGEGKAG